MRLLLAIDLRNEDAEHIVDQAVAWAERLEATLDLVWVDAFGTWRPFTLDRKLADLLTSQVEHTRQTDRDHLELLRQRIPSARRGVAHAVPGDPVKTIPDQAKGYDALLLGSGERLGDRVGVGSLEAKLVRYAPCSVLVLPHAA